VAGYLRQVMPFHLVGVVVGKRIKGYDMAAEMEASRSQVRSNEPCRPGDENRAARRRRDVVV
jgi:hypothetical protein